MFDKRKLSTTTMSEHIAEQLPHQNFCFNVFGINTIFEKKVSEFVIPMTQSNVYGKGSVLHYYITKKEKW